MAANLVRVRRLTRQPLRLGKTNITNSGDGSVVDLNDATTARDIYRFQGRFVVMGAAESGYAAGDSNMDPNEADTDLALTQSVILFTPMELGKNLTINGFTVISGATPAGTPTAGFAGLYTSDGTTLTRVAVSADFGSTPLTASTAAPKTFTSPYVTPKPDTYVFAIVWVATTAPSVVGRKPLNAVVANLGAPKQYATLAGATLPTTQAISGLTATNLVPFIQIT